MNADEQECVTTFLYLFGLMILSLLSYCRRGSDFASRDLLFLDVNGIRERRDIDTEAAEESRRKQEPSEGINWQWQCWLAPFFLSVTPLGCTPSALNQD